jgi:hypothetical protein
METILTAMGYITGYLVLAALLLLVFGPIAAFIVASPIFICQDFFSPPNTSKPQKGVSEELGFVCEDIGLMDKIRLLFRPGMNINGTVVFKRSCD